MNKKQLKLINILLLSLLILVAYLSLMVISHEGWHIINHGEPQGFCVGWVESDGGHGLASLSYGNPTYPDGFNEEALREEKQAWWFGIIISSLLVGLFLFTERELYGK